MILHCLKKEIWQALQGQNDYEADSLAREGFIHCSSPWQFWRVALHFCGRGDSFVLLCLDVKKLQAPVRYEDGGDGRLYPHLYGPLNLDAVVRVLPFLEDEAGNWIKNKELEAWPNR